VNEHSVSILLVNQKFKFKSEKGDFFMNSYTKEWVGTLVFFALYVLMGHTGLWFAPLTADSGIHVLGFPIHYIFAVVAGWLGLFAVSLFWVKWADRLDEEIAAENEQAFDQHQSSPQNISVGR
jgi:uncharacterized membrane protein